MATREENLQKINEQLEQLSDEQLEQVAGGSKYENDGDALQLAMHALITHDVYWELISDPKKLTDFIRKLGYTGYQANEGENNNVYTDKNGVKLSRSDFWKKFDEEYGSKSHIW